MAFQLKKGSLHRLMLVTASLIWGSLILLGSRALLHYEYGSATPGASPAQWPGDSAIQRPGDKFVLVMAAHPDCPCTRASVVQLEQLMARLKGNLVAFVLFSKPESSGEEIRASELWKKAGAIPGVSVLYDPHAVESARFGSRVSGQTMLYDPAGRLLFMGGLTSARGREGDSAGADAVILRVSGATQSVANTPVFGCSLYDPDAKELREDSSWKKR